MLYRASLKDVTDGRISRRYAHTVVVMQYYPRFFKKELCDEYVRALAPDRKLFTEFKARDREGGDHDRAFAEVNYEARFTLSPEGLEHLARLSGLSTDRDVFLLCQCQSLERCHTDLLLLIAKHRFLARTATVRLRYPIFEQRLAAGEDFL